MRHLLYAQATTPTLELTSQQMSLLDALEHQTRLASGEYAESILQRTGLVVVCPVCAINLGTVLHITAENHPSDAIWKVDCECTHRRFHRQAIETLRMPKGELLMAAITHLPAARLAVRCPIKRTKCLTTPLTAADDGVVVTVRCQCWQIDLKAGIHRFTRHLPAHAGIPS